MHAISMSIKEAAKALGISHVTMYKEISAGRLKTFMIGRRRLVSSDALRHYIEAREKESA